MRTDVDTSNRFANMSIISALMVVLIHVLKRPQEPGSLSYGFRYLTGEGICRIAVPFFFLAAGYFIARHLDEPGYWKREVLKRVKTLVVPFFAWSTICFVLCSGLIIMANIFEGRDLCTGLFSFNRIMRSLGIHPFNVPELRQLWFVRVLFIFVLLLPLFQRYLSKGACLAASFVVYLIFKPLGSNLIGGQLAELINFGFFSLEGMFYFSLGIYLAREKLDRIIASLKVGFAMLSLGLVVMMLRARFGVFNDVVLYASVPLMLLGVLSLIPDRPFGFLRGYSFPIYLIHLNVVFVYFFVLDYFCSDAYCRFFDPGASLMGAGVCFSIVLGVSVSLAKLIKHTARRYPVIDNILFGGR